MIEIMEFSYFTSDVVQDMRKKLKQVFFFFFLS